MQPHGRFGMRLKIVFLLKDPKETGI